MFRATRIITFFSLLVLCTLSFTLVFRHFVADVNSPPAARGLSFYKRELYGHSTDFSVLNIRQDGDSGDAGPPDGGDGAEGGDGGSPSLTPTANPSPISPTVTPSAQTPTKTSAPAKPTQTPKETSSPSNSPTNSPTSAPAQHSSSQSDDDTASNSVASSTSPATITGTASSAAPSSSSSAQSSASSSSRSASASSASPSSLSNSVPSVSSTAQSTDSLSIPPSAPSTPLSQPSNNVKNPSTTVSAAPTGDADDSTGFFHNKGAVAGTFGSIGIIAAIVLGFAATSWIRRRRRARRESDEEDAAYFEPKYPIGRTYSDLAQAPAQSREVGSGPLGASATDVAAVPATAEAYPDRAVHYGGYEPRTDVYTPTDYGISYPPGTSFDHHGAAPEPDNNDAYDAYGTYQSPHEIAPPQREYQPSPLSNTVMHPFADPANAMGRHPPAAYLQSHGAPDSMYAPSVDSFYGSGSGHYPHAQ